MSIVALDRAAFAALNGNVGRSPWLDGFLLFSTNAPLVKLALPLALIVALWFGRPDGARRRIIAGIAGVMAALLLVRVLQNFLPPRLRPIHDLAGAHLADGLSQTMLQGWSSFPSDHAALGFALATMAWLLSRPLGLLAAAWVLFIVCLPRVYLGYHYPGDILAGGLAGVLCVLATDRLLPRFMATPIRWADTTPAVFYPFAFSLLFLIGTLFSDVRDFGRYLKGFYDDGPYDMAPPGAEQPAA